MIVTRVLLNAKQLATLVERSESLTLEFKLSNGTSGLNRGQFTVQVIRHRMVALHYCMAYVRGKLADNVGCHREHKV